MKHVATELIHIAKALTAYRPYKNMRGDPRWMKSRYPGVAVDGTPFNKGDEILYWPRMPKGKNVMVGDQAEDAWRQFESEAADEEFMSGRRSKDQSREATGDVSIDLAMAFNRAGLPNKVTPKDVEETDGVGFSSYSIWEGPYVVELRSVGGKLMAIVNAGEKEANKSFRAGDYSNAIKWVSQQLKRNRQSREAADITEKEVLEILSKQLLKLAKTFISTDIPSGEMAIAKKMKKKGYNYAVQITTKDGEFGEPLYFKNPNEVGPLLRSFPDYQNAKIKWTAKLDSIKDD